VRETRGGGADYRNDLLRGIGARDFREVPRRISQARRLVGFT
jgi:hypothetical protein